MSFLRFVTVSKAMAKGVLELNRISWQGGTSSRSKKQLLATPAVCDMH